MSNSDDTTPATEGMSQNVSENDSSDFVTQCRAAVGTAIGVKVIDIAREQILKSTDGRLWWVADVLVKGTKDQYFIRAQCSRNADGGLDTVVSDGRTATPLSDASEGTSSE